MKSFLEDLLKIFKSHFRASFVVTIIAAFLSMNAKVDRSTYFVLE